MKKAIILTLTLGIISIIYDFIFLRINRSLSWIYWHENSLRWCY